MKKIIRYFLMIIIVFSFSLPVFAQDYELNQLIPVDTTATVKTEKFNYVDFVYKSKVNGKGNTSIHFNKITNNNVTKVPVSINILLFDQAEKNIGFLTYCSDKDISSDNNGKKINANQSIEFTINVTTRYFVEGKFPKDVKFIAVMDENKYCQIGGYDKYDGLTIGQITGKEVNNNKTSKQRVDELFPFLQDRDLMMLIITIGGAIVGFLIYGAFLNSVYRKMYAKTTPLAFLPITNNYVCMKMAFGNIVALIYGVIYALTGILYIVGVRALFILASVLAVPALVIVIIKMITKKYDLFYFEPAIQNPVNNNNFGMNGYNNNNFNNNDFNNNNYNNNQGQQTIDLSYNQPVDFSGSSDNLNISSGESRVQEDNSNNGEFSVNAFLEEEDNNSNQNTMNNDVQSMMMNNNQNMMNNNGQNMTNNNNEGESDLSKFFH